MEQNEDRSPAIEELLGTSPTEAWLRLQVTDLLLGRLRDVRMGWSTSEQSDVLQQIEAALDAYGSYFYPPSTANEAVTVPHDAAAGRTCNSCLGSVDFGAMKE